MTRDRLAAAKAAFSQPVRPYGAALIDVGRSLGEQKANLISSAAVAAKICTVSFVDARGMRHVVDVEAESLYEAAVLGVRRFRKDPWIEPIGTATVLDVDVREPSTRHAISLNQVERWLAGATTNPNEASKKAKLKMLLVQG